ncbi:hypothetical protein HHI36_000114 [Cryptolaemus montrouzieri]|uniref:Protein sleepless n=1 Tax=Cryptolaemus montrouzieri TaxID=559131 RepID=A0ABD2P3U2_9CUCU
MILRNSFLLFIILRSILFTSSQRIWTSYVYPDVTKAKSMVCYQCQTNMSEVFPVCESNMLKIATKAEKQELLYFCPPFADKYCFKMMTWEGNLTTVTRGCVGENDAHGHSLRTGCVHFENENSMLCLCDTIACNSSYSKVGQINTSLVFLCFIFVCSI